mmetsp:Transcript_491/g.1407  ORF Transcript_491/g.1407 Transcript_491/m.1407 type:complete len:378 (+) Transcript_491:106-1239(+)
MRWQALARRLLPPRSAVAAAAAAAATAAVAVAYTEPRLRAAEPDHIFVINGFYMAMREKYTKPGASIHYYLVEWEPSELAWFDFRMNVLGSTDPAAAQPGSLRNIIYSDWRALGLASEPNVGDNGVHASASPFEAMCERLNWVGMPLEEDSFGRALLDAGIPRATILEWTRDPQVPFEGKKQSLFDALEDSGYAECLAKAQAIAGVSGAIPEGKMQAFVFIKPHAVTGATQTLVARSLAEAGVKIYAEGELDAAAIERDRLIDNHYYAIANKASLTQPRDLNPPAAKQEEFRRKFGIAWRDAVEAGLVYNAVDGCKRLGIGGSAMDAKWASAKKEGALVKFGGGFYAGKISADSASPASWATPLLLSLYALLGGLTK